MGKRRARNEAQADWMLERELRWAGGYVGYTSGLTLPGASGSKDTPRRRRTGENRPPEKARTARSETSPPHLSGTSCW